MCGINGLFYFDRHHPVEEATLNRMCWTTRHRGPDDTGRYIQSNVGLGFNRLSIIDLAGGHQPMTNEDSTVWVVFNGEIYNFSDLREELAGRGHTFQTRSDTEVIVHGWEEWGEQCVEKLRGMFAFVVWDARRRVLFGARDRVGIKPFYYYQDDELFAFSSEIKGLLEVPGISRDVDPAAIGEFLRHRYVIGPHTVLRDIHKLQPGHTITVDADGSRIRRYWEPPHDELQISESDALDQIDALIEESVRLHLVSDVPLGAFLSGGVDSSAVVAMMSRLGVADIKTFSVGYDSPESELEFARVTADHFHTDHYALRMSATHFRDLLPGIVWAMDEPLGDDSTIPLHALSKFARQKVTVVLSGEGSDEIFAGYPVYRRQLLVEALNRAPGMGVAAGILNRIAPDGRLRKYASMLGKPLESRYQGVSRTFTDNQISRIMPAPFPEISETVAAIYDRCRSLPALARMSHVDLATWLPDNLLLKGDRMTMANSLELRVPLLDHKLVEFGMRLPQNLRLRGRTTKYLLRKSMAPVLPSRIANRRKIGFPVPIRSWFRSELSGFARETLLASGGAVETFFRRQEVERLLEQHQNTDFSGQIFSLLVLDQWYRQFVKADSSRSVPATVV
jgi:asparagine synthase (glutamine-hydrolysing)